MNEKQLFEAGCFLPSWAEDVEQVEMPISQAYTRHNKDLQTLISELDEIKEHIEDIQDRQWNLARLIHFHENNFARE